MITAHDFPSAHVADHAGMDMILVGDSLAMVALGMEDTSEVLMEEMLLHCKSVARATSAAFTVRTSLSMALKHALTEHRLAIYPWEATRSHPSKP
jgi:ketopantoate hydroxymethyltransferase